MEEKRQELVSVIVPVYNKEDKIAKCIKSIQEQDYSSIEILLIDDGSTDKSFDICSLYAQTDNRIIIKQQKNNGVSSARNYGLRIMRGQYVTFIDADDTVQSNYISSLLSHMSQDTEMVACTCNAIINNKSVPQCFFGDNIDGQLYKDFKKKLFMQLMDTNYGQKKPVYTGIGVPWGKLYRVDFLRKNNIFFSEILDHYEDNLFNLEVLFSAHRIIYINDCLYNYSTDHISKVLDKYEKKVVDSYINLFQLRYDLIMNNIDKIDEESYNAFIMSSLDLFDIAIFSMLITNSKLSFFDLRKNLKQYVEKSGYGWFFRGGVSKCVLPCKRKLLYRLTGAYFYTSIILMVRLRNLIR